MDTQGERGKDGPSQRPDLLQAFREVGEAGRSGLGAARDAGKAMRTLVAADVSLARSAFGRTLALTGVAIAFGATTWLMLMGALVAGLVLKFGWAWWLAMLLTAALSAVATAGATWGAMRYFDHTRMKATRRQLARLGIGELAEHMPGASSTVTAREATHAPVAETPYGEPKKSEQGIDVTPP